MSETIEHIISSFAHAARDQDDQTYNNVAKLIHSKLAHGLRPQLDDTPYFRNEPS